MSKKKNIKNAALNLFMELGYGNVTADMIVQKAAVSKGLLFFHFKSFNGLVEELVLDWLVPKWRALIELDTKDLELLSCIEMIFDMTRSGLINNEPHYRLFFSIMLSEPQMIQKIELENNEAFQNMFTYISNIFINRSIPNVEDEIMLLSTTLMGLEMAYCLNKTESRLVSFDTSKKMFLKRYHSMIS